MKRKYQIYFNTFIACLVLLLAWSVWNSMAQGVRTNAPATNAVATNAVATNAVVEVPNALGAEHLDVATDWLQALSRKLPCGVACPPTPLSNKRDLLILATAKVFALTPTRIF